MPFPPRTLIAGNWKMNGLRASLAEVEAVAASAPRPGPEVLICPPATLVAAAFAAAAGRIAIGGQDCHAKPSGAFTGDIAAPMLKDAGAAYVIAGHSERRALHAEDDATVRAKAVAAVEAGLTAIVCVGETLAERDAGRAEAVVTGQLTGSLPEGATPETIVVAYEPVWAIGTGRTPSSAEIAEMHGAIRALLVSRFGDRGKKVPILYGGSMKPANAAEILKITDVNGGLVGGASLLAKDFHAIISAN